VSKVIKTYGNWTIIIDEESSYTEKQKQEILEMINQINEALLKSLENAPKEGQ